MIDPAIRSQNRCTSLRRADSALWRWNAVPERESRMDPRPSTSPNQPERTSRPRPAESAAPRLADLRPASPGQLALIGGGLWLLGVLAPALGFLVLVGVALLLVAGLSLLIRPRAREMYWRGRRIDAGGEPTWGEQLYRKLYRR